MPRRTQRERSAASASRLLDAAIELIATQGFAATTQADIGTRAGYSRAMVRERFGSGEALLDALFERLVDNWHLQMAPLMAGLTGPEVLAVGLELFRDRLRQHPMEARALFVLQFEAAGPTRSLRDRVAAVNRALMTGVATALRDGQAEGTVRHDIDPDTAAADWVAQFRGANFLWLVDPGYDLDGFCARWAEQQMALFGPIMTSSSVG
jgi:AcrR family transcriptional regulator